MSTIVNHNYRFVFVHIPKTGGTSITKALKRTAGNSLMPHMTPDELLRRAGIAPDILRTHFSFCIVRDPWERLGSLHRFLTTTPGKHRRAALPTDLNEFVALLADPDQRVIDYRTIRPQSSYARQMSFVGRFERLEEDFAHLAQLIGLPYLKLGRRNVSGSAVSYRDMMTACSQAILANYYREDIERFGYDKADNTGADLRTKAHSDRREGQVFLRKTPA